MRATMVKYRKLDNNLFLKAIGVVSLKLKFFEAIICESLTRVTCLFNHNTRAMHFLHFVLSYSARYPIIGFHISKLKLRRGKFQKITVAVITDWNYNVLFDTGQNTTNVYTFPSAILYIRNECKRNRFSMIFPNKMPVQLRVICFLTQKSNIFIGVNFSIAFKRR